MNTTECFCPNAEGIFVPHRPVEHREQEYDPAGFDTLRDMQARHFWYLGRHRFLLGALKFALRQQRTRPLGLKAIDLGGGCGGWARYLQEHWRQPFAELALADSSLRALELAANVVGPDVARYQVDLLDLPWEGRWDVIFLLDVLEHVPEDDRALGQLRQALRPGGLAFVATPALRAFWSYNDDLANHLRRYSRRDLARLAARCGLEICFIRYFQFFLSPLLLLSRMRSPNVAGMSERDIREHLNRTHRVPSQLINHALRFIFFLETPVGLWLPFPWGTSVLAVLRRPD